MSERFMVDDAGTLIDISTRDTFDYVSDTVDLLNRLNDENEMLKVRFNEERERALNFCRDIDTLIVENEQLKQFKKEVFKFIDEMIDYYDEERFCEEEDHIARLYGAKFETYSSMKEKISEIAGDVE